MANVWLWIPLLMISIFHSILLLSYFAKFSLVSHQTATVSGMQARFVTLYVSYDSVWQMLQVFLFLFSLMANEPQSYFENCTCFEEALATVCQGLTL